MAEAAVQSYGFWGMLTLLALQNIIIPLANKIIPAKVKAGIDNEQRMVVAVEQTAKLLIQVVEIQRKSAEDHTRILSSLSQHSESLAVLLDRVDRVDKNNPKKK
jgi:GTP-binding protein EngB required for normal cell division